MGNSGLYIFPGKQPYDQKILPVMENFHLCLRPDLQRGFRPINIDLQESKD